MTWLERAEEIALSAGGFIAAGVIAGAWWVVRKFFTDSARLDLLERQMMERVDHHNEFRKDVKHDFERMDSKLDSIQEALRK